ncbi:hypothetical protein PENTCL1PPCAC_16046, partial [Pristionchus entomophagus]
VLVIALLVCVIQVKSLCDYINNMVIETGYPARETTADERAQLVVYGEQWIEWGAQFSRYMLRRDTMPPPSCLA